jgi:hypothetical protein
VKIYDGTQCQKKYEAEVHFHLDLLIYVISFDNVLAAMLSVINIRTLCRCFFFASTMRTSHVLRYAFHISGSLRTNL